MKTKIRLNTKSISASKPDKTTSNDDDEIVTPKNKSESVSEVGEYTIYEFVDFQQQFKSIGRSLQLSSQKQIYDRILTLFKNIGDGDRATKENLIKMAKDNDKVNQYLDKSTKSDATKKAYYHGLLIFNEINGLDVCDYQTKFNQYNTKIKSNVEHVKSTISDETWKELHNKLETEVAEINLEHSKFPEILPIQLVMRLQRIILMILYLELPIFNNEEYCLIKNVSDDNSNYYDHLNHNIVIVNKRNYTKSVIKIPEKYWLIFDIYYKSALAFSKYFLFTERTKDMYVAANYSNHAKNKVFGVELQSIRSKRAELKISSQSIDGESIEDC